MGHDIGSGENLQSLRNLISEMSLFGADLSENLGACDSNVPGWKICENCFRSIDVEDNLCLHCPICHQSREEVERLNLWGLRKFAPVRWISLQSSCRSVSFLFFRLGCLLQRYMRKRPRNSAPAHFFSLLSIFPSWGSTATWSAFN